MEKKIVKRSAVVSLIGRPNVGKSSLFNRLMRSAHQAITHNLPGVTRDRHYGITTLDESHLYEPEDIILVDTGGFYPEPDKAQVAKKDSIKAFFNIMIDHGKLAIKESDLVLLVVDIREGLNPFDKMIVDFVRREKKDFLLLINKYDSSKQDGEEAIFYELGLNQEQMILTSAEHGLGLDQLRVKIQQFASEHREQGQQKELQKGIKPRYDVVGSIAIVGSPNAGKSTLLNTLVGAQRALVSDIAGTTVDPIEAYIDLDFGKNVKSLKHRENDFRKLDEKILDEYQQFLEASTQEEIEEKERTPLVEKEIEAETEQLRDDNALDQVENTWRSIKIVDTAGIRKSGKVEGFLESQSVYSALRSISESDLILFVVDATKGITHQDRRLMDISIQKGKSLIICMNKIDLIADTINDHNKRREWLLDIRDDIRWLSYVEIIPISALRKNHLNKIHRSIVKTLYVRHRKVGTAPLNRLLAEMIEKKSVILKGSRGQRFKVKYASMIKSDPPTFIIFCNKSQGMATHYRRYLQNGVRRRFKLDNTPVHLIFRSSADLEKRASKKKKKSKGKATK